MKTAVSETTDEVIARAVAAGDVAAFGKLVERYQEKLIRYGHKFLRGYADIEDAVQEVFIKTYQNINSFDANKKFSSWIYRIAHNEFINLIKKKGREPLPFFDPDTLWPHPLSRESADDGIKRSEAKAQVESGLDKLSPKYREILVLYYLEELSYQEIADILRVPMATVGVRLKRGRAALKKFLHE